MATGHLRPASCTLYTKSELESSAKERSKREQDWNGEGKAFKKTGKTSFACVLICWPLYTSLCCLHCVNQFLRHTVLGLHEFEQTWPDGRSDCSITIAYQLALGRMEDLIVALPSALTSLHLAGWKI